MFIFRHWGHLISIGFLVLLSLFSQAAIPPVKAITHTPSIRFSASNSWSEPFAIYDENKNLTGGAVKEVMDALAAKMGRSPQYITLPRKAVDTASESRKIDARCYVVESWVQDPSIFDWSKPLFNVVNVIAFSKKSDPIRRPANLKGKTLGTVLGYKYPVLEPFFASGSVQRDDVSRETANIQKLLLGRIQYAVVEASEFAWHLKTHAKDKENFNLKDFHEIERYPVKCAVVKNGNASVQEFDRAIATLRKEGFFKRLTAKYEIQ